MWILRFPVGLKKGVIGEGDTKKGLGDTPYSHICTQIIT